MIQINSSKINFQNLEKKIQQTMGSSRNYTSVKNLDAVNIHHSESKKLTLPHASLKVSNTRTYKFLKKIDITLSAMGLSTIAQGLKNIFKKLNKSGYDKNQKVYVINDFLKYNDAEFINNVYIGILNREIEPKSFEYNLHLLHSGSRTKMDILLFVRYSEEGMMNNVKILGIRKRYIKQLVYKTPVMGYLLKTLDTFFRIPKLIRRLNALEAMLNTKVSLEDFHKEIHKKVNLDDFHKDIQQKVSHIDLQEGLHKKVNLDEHHKELQSKVSLEDFNEELQKKTSLEDFHKEVQTKVNLEDFHKEIQKKTSLEEFHKEVQTKVNLEDFHKDIYAIQTALSSSQEGVNTLSAQVKIFAKDVKEATNYLKYVEMNLQKLVEKAESSIETADIKDKTILNALIEEKEHILDALYLSFEDRFRGDRDGIKERQKYYLPIVQNIIKNGSQSLLDIGCGRGEWLELLKENSINAKGIDLNRLMVKSALEYGLDVVNADAISYLRNLDDESLDVITGFHIVEHLPFQALISLFDESLRVLKIGGMIIFETPNPENLIVGSCSFYTDPTHLNPIPPITLEFLALNRGFSNVEVHRLHPIKDVVLLNTTDEDVNNLIYASTKEQDYSIIGMK